MRLRDRLAIALADGGWNHLSSSEVYYRWRWIDDEQVREELCIVRDRPGHIRAWSVWRNVRQDLDQETGRTERLLAYARLEADSE